MRTDETGLLPVDIDRKVLDTAPVDEPEEGCSVLFLSVAGLPGVRRAS